VNIRSKRALQIVSGLLVLVLVAYLGMSAYLATRATRATRSAIQSTPAAQGLAFEPVTLTSPVDGELMQGWFLPSGTSRRTIVMLHGLDADRWEGRMADIGSMFVREGFNVLTYDLRGHGVSGGTSIGLGWLERHDVGKALEFLEGKGLKREQTGIWGVSYGTATALLASAQYQLPATVVDSAIADQRDLFDQEIKRVTGMPPIFTPGISLFASLFYGLNLEEMPPLKALPAIAPRPILFIHGDADTRVPLSHSQRLKAASRGPNDDLWVVPGGTHADAFKEMPAEYTRRATEFYRRFLPA
jgi:fermentation-respiration switch protein FrsA (DUF1100 family)